MKENTTRGGMALLAITMLMLSTSCEKQGVDLFCGNYSFKTSGNISATRDASCMVDTTYELRPLQLRIDTVVKVHDLPSVIMLDNEFGQMDITATDDVNGRAVMTMNVTGGELITYPVTVVDNEIVLEPTRRHMTLSSGLLNNTYDDDNLNNSTIVGDVMVEGSARRYDNIVLIDLQYSGDFTVNGRLYHIGDSHVTCRGKRNE